MKQREVVSALWMLNAGCCYDHLTETGSKQLSFAKCHISHGAGRGGGRGGGITNTRSAQKCAEMFQLFRGCNSSFARRKIMRGDAAATLGKGRCAEIVRL